MTTPSYELRMLAGRLRQNPNDPELVAEALDYLLMVVADHDEKVTGLRLREQRRE